MNKETNNGNVKFNIMVKPAFFQGSPVDHTYVKFDDGTAFPCAGGNSGGKKLKDGSGEENLQLAKKFNKPMSIPIIIHVPFLGDKTIFHIPTGDTGIIYGINGVCHMMADRILVESKVTVKEARGFFLSSGLFGIYGVHVPYSMSTLIGRLLDTVLKKLPKYLRVLLKKALSNIGGSPVSAFAKILERGVRKTWKQRLKENNIDGGEYMKNINADQLSLHDKLDFIYSDENLMTYPDIALQEHEAVIKDILGDTIDDNMVQDLIKYMKEFNDQISIEKNSLANDGSSNKDLIEDINRKTNEYLKNVHNLVGDEKYEKLFNTKLDEEVVLFDNDQFDSMLKDVGDSLEEQFKN
ncbi:MAG: hypothetical protein KAJ49_06435 [Arcobacteraceae bacterium]|nr:hypothetical protein [Arcobacteraceae bacterium]